MKVEREIPVGEGVDVQCACGRELHLFFNGGEMDQRICVDCGRKHELEIRSVFLVSDA